MAPAAEPTAFGGRMSTLILAQLRRHWFHYVAASLSIAVIVAGLVIDGAMTASTAARVHELAHRLGKNMLVLPAALEPADFYRQRFGSASLPADAVERLRASDVAVHLKVIERRLYGTVDLKGDSFVVVGEDRVGSRVGALVKHLPTENSGRRMVAARQW